MSDTLTIPLYSEQNSLDFGYVGTIAVVEAQRSQKVKDSHTLSKAKEAARITAGDLVKQFGESRFKPETLDLFANMDDAPSVRSAAPTAPAPAPQKPMHSAASQAKADTPVTIATSKPETVLFPFTEANLKSAKPFTEDSPRLAKPLPLSSSLGREQARIRQAKELANKPVVGLVRIVHSSDGKMRREQLKDKDKIEAVAKKVSNAAFDPWADMVRKRIAEQSSATAEMHEPEMEAPKVSGPRPRF